LTSSGNSASDANKFTASPWPSVICPIAASPATIGSAAARFVDGSTNGGVSMALTGGTAGPDGPPRAICQMR
jgi:hypothetical protein